MKYTLLCLILLLVVPCWAQIPELSPSPEASPILERETESTQTITETSKPEVLRVGVSGSPPFVVPVGKDLEGMAVETWRALAEELGVEFKIQDAGSIEELLQGVHDGLYDVAVGPISITSERATFVAFTQPYYDSSLGILSLVKPPKRHATLEINLRQMLLAVGALLLVLGLVGAVFWILERKANREQFPMEPASGIGNGMWMALVTMTTVGYGDRAPVSAAGRIFTGIWMLITTVTLSSFTAWIATTLTVSQLEDSTLTEASQLRDRRVAVVKGTTSEVFGRHYTSRLIFVDNYKNAIQKLELGSVDAVVYDYPVLAYYLQQNPDLPLRLAESTFALQDYGFALARNDQRVHRFNVGLLRLNESGLLREIRHHWFRSDPDTRL